MKKIITLVLTICSLQVYSQDAGIRITNQSDNLESKNPLYTINLDGKTISLGKFGTLENIDPNWISSINVLKGQSAYSLYGNKGKDGVVIIDLKSSDESRAYFEEELKRYKHLTEINELQDASHTETQENTITPRSTSVTVKVKGQFNYLENPPLVVVELGDERLEMQTIGKLNTLNTELIDEINVLKDKASLALYKAEDKPGVVLIKLKDNKKSAKEFKKIKKAIKKKK
ncbi:hypothetical protein [uncultured Roseivirga sp.]|mgnify:CR=1 FL=1|uniref:hypothetical protein n=1 Tax=uncultured Roseivirga sp. TaxID=543088 RepID=UPI000D7A77BB|nr:hypothetical protein [uncultured Roseivirga sp.]PWL32178.1 MAG: hypothetical protein DCO95_03080 [Roseivirga sp. XM-24bin3]